ncbi:MAG: UDP-2,3-diacylglucosamine diphosphatase [Planctomycetota bacterium]|jgi:UDP-2,3-diacylglucosamine pyrophosphatase LpxH
MYVEQNTQERNVRTLIVSDVHLGCRFSQAENFLAFLNTIRPERFYILGDFFDGWKLGVKWRWEPVYSRILDRVFDLAAGGTELFYTPGNHDSFLRCPEIGRFLSRSGVTVTIRDEFVFDTISGRRLLVLHGDRFDIVETKFQWMSMFLTYAYEPLLSMNWLVNRVSGRACSPYKGCAIVKDKVKTAIRFFERFENQMVSYGRERGCDGAICGHIHTPGIVSTPSFTYINTGDWVENCTGLIEYHNGDIVLEPFYPDRSVQTLQHSAELDQLPVAVPNDEYASPYAESAARIA